MPRNPATRRAWNQKNAERLRRYYRAYYHGNKQKFNTAAKKASQREWRRKNKARVLELQRLWYAKHGYKASENHKQKRDSNRFNVPLTRKKMSADEARLSRNRASSSSKARQHQLYWSFKSQMKCTNCGEDDPVCLDLHHENRHEKEINLGTRARCVSREKLERELLKCVPLCSNCHRKHHHKERNGLRCFQLLSEEEKRRITADAVVLYQQYESQRKLS